mmetsp:Transcript_2350/g.7780  ORF Transcript_2350/g.7780 Transcript_2350/m.7780 type:complete len:564 (-) Transcript_2350:693-2384(-)
MQAEPCVRLPRSSRARRSPYSPAPLMAGRRRPCLRGALLHGAHDVRRLLLHAAVRLAEDVRGVVHGQGHSVSSGDGDAARVPGGRGLRGGRGLLATALLPSQRLPSPGQPLPAVQRAQVYRGHQRAVLVLGDGLVRHLRVGGGRLEPREEGDALELVLEVVEGRGDGGGLRVRIEGHRAGHLVVRPVALEEGGEAELLPHGELVHRPEARAGVHGEGDHEGALLVPHGGLHGEPGAHELAHELRPRREPHTAQVEARLGIVQPGGGARKEGDGAAGLDRGELDGARDAEALRVGRVRRLEGRVAVVAPLAQLAEAAPRDELGDPRDGAPHAAVAEHDAVGLGPLGLPEGDRLGVQEGRLEGPRKVRKVLVAVWECLHEAAELVRLEGLLQARVTPRGPPVGAVLHAVHAPVAPHVVQPGKPRLAVARDAADQWAVVHSQLGEDRVVGGPAVGHALGIHLVVLEVDVLLAVRLPKGDLRGAPHVARDHAFPDEVHHVHDGRDRYGCARVARQGGAHLLVELSEGLGARGHAAEALDGRPRGAHEAVVQLHGALAEHVVVYHEAQ